MKKGIITILSILALILTFTFAELFSIYSFGSIPTLLTSIYLISIFAIIEYLLISTTYIIRKLIKKEKLKIKQFIGLFLLFFSLILVLSFIVFIDIDYLTWYDNSYPLYLNIIVRSVEFLLPSTILIVISVLLIKIKGNPNYNLKARTSYEANFIYICMLYSMFKWLY